MFFLIKVMDVDIQVPIESLSYYTGALIHLLVPKSDSMKVLGNREDSKVCKRYNASV